MVFIFPPLVCPLRLVSRPLNYCCKCTNEHIEAAKFTILRGNVGRSLIELKSRAHGIGPAVRPPGRPIDARRCRPPDVERGIALAPSLSFRVPGGRRLNG